MSARSRRLRVQILVALASTCVARNVEELVVHNFSPVLILHLYAALSEHYRDKGEHWTPGGVSLSEVISFSQENINVWEAWIYSWDIGCCWLILLRWCHEDAQKRSGIWATRCLQNAILITYFDETKCLMRETICKWQIWVYDCVWKWRSRWIEIVECALGYEH